MPFKFFSIYTDASCIQGRTSFAYNLYCAGKRTSVSGMCPAAIATIDEAELFSIAKAVSHAVLMGATHASINTDSMVSIAILERNAASPKKEVIVREVRAELMKLQGYMLFHVKSHSGNKYNQKVDAMAKNTLKKYLK